MKKTENVHKKPSLSGNDKWDTETYSVDNWWDQSVSNEIQRDL